MERVADTRLITRSELFTKRPLKCQLVVVEGPDAGRAVSLDQAREVGTANGCALKLTDESVSAKHLSVAPKDGAFEVTDLGSTNGTLFEGAKVTQVRVGPGASFKLGRTLLRIQAEAAALEVTPSRARRFGELVGESLAMRELFAVLELAAQSEVTVLVQGETGTGKELVARALHDASARRGGPFVAVDCGALPESLLESELFGHVKGAFTGASERRAGAFLRADKGTLFLDELGGVSAAVQARLLRVLEERRVKAVGADSEVPVDVRVVAASRVNLEQAVAQGSFRSDLFYRLSVLSVELPPLRNRREDIPALVSELLRRRGFEAGPISGAGYDALRAHGWPGNVRELRNVLERALALSPAATSFAQLKVSLGPVETGGGLSVRTELPFKEAKDAVVDAFEAEYLRELMSRHGGNLSAAAREAGVDRKHWRSLLEKHGLRVASADSEE
ncbi:MAG: sigma 54-interacting transcriptional regulator [Myxococcaceae bacterium]